MTWAKLTVGCIQKSMMRGSTKVTVVEGVREGVGVRVGEEEEVGTTVAVADSDRERVAEVVRVWVGEAVGEGEGVKVGTEVAVGVQVGVRDGVLVGLDVRVGVAVAEGDREEVGV